jgi:hypothetical protein
MGDIVVGRGVVCSRPACVAPLGSTQVSRSSGHDGGKVMYRAAPGAHAFQDPDGDAIAIRGGG